MSDELDEMEEIITEFIVESEESLERIEPLFVELEQKGEDEALINEIFRSMHTIKGAAGFLGFQQLVDVAHAAENIMKKNRDKEIPLSKDIMDVILKSIDMLRLLMTHLKEKDGVEENIKPLVKELETVLKNALSGKDGSSDTAADTLVTPTETPAEVSEDAKAEITDRSPEQMTSIPDRVSNEATDNTTLIEKPVQTASDQADKEQDQAATAKADGWKPATSAQNLRVDVERIDKVLDLAGEVVLIRNRLLNISHYYDQKYSHDEQTETLLETVSFLDRVTSDLQLSVMKMRMQPIKKVLSKFPRLIRDMSASLNKEVDLQIFGEGTEVDKTVIEHIGDPMTHILRNSIDHGLESMEDRIAKGKPAKGTVTINTFQKGNQVVIEIKDDGKGMDVEMLKQKAVSKGLISEEEAKKMSDEAATDIIFMPGFSTVEVATELSGRGVGMDVVKTNISLLNGYVDVSTDKDVGTTFRIFIPLTLAIMQALMVEVSGAKYAIPLSPIEETLKVSNEEVENITGQDVIVIRDKVCPLFELNTLLGMDTAGHVCDKHKYLVVISMGEKRFCIAVDKLLGQEEVVIKTLKGIDSTASRVLGASITGDGKVVFIIDVAGLSRNLLSMTI